MNHDGEIVSDGVVDVVVVDEEREQHLVWPWSGSLAQPARSSSSFSFFSALSQKISPPLLLGSMGPHFSNSSPSKDLRPFSDTCEFRYVAT